MKKQFIMILIIVLFQLPEIFGVDIKSHQYILRGKLNISKIDSIVTTLKEFTDTSTLTNFINENEDGTIDSGLIRKVTLTSETFKIFPANLQSKRTHYAIIKRNYHYSDSSIIDSSLVAQEYINNYSILELKNIGNNWEILNLSKTLTNDFRMNNYNESGDIENILPIKTNDNNYCFVFIKGMSFLASFNDYKPAEVFLKIDNEFVNVFNYSASYIEYFRIDNFEVSCADKEKIYLKSKLKNKFNTYKNSSKKLENKIKTLSAKSNSVFDKTIDSLNFRLASERTLIIGCDVDFVIKEKMGIYTISLKYKWFFCFKCDLIKRTHFKTTTRTFNAKVQQSFGEHEKEYNFIIENGNFSLDDLYEEGEIQKLLGHYDFNNQDNDNVK